ncbi:hypothetical protein BpOF4_17535 [Alkalihalophilus pseudofirmus OF4]|uniref:Menaquinol-cytochrome c reductase cytochrome b subunit n=1 Tax=Alkalihalophilus pseudofirmus (strain ATCC BAA-2126 / JCM 17055 / OF4) TaxID=398511 RepID=D3FRF7_ALKPO|nr:MULTISPECIES: hypothetical protein [Alkalihalophilus]ADC51548.1 hypothetical protein BpOF4_17535 [Alkalihalophilus pseudofirmus OF4]MED1603338.1 hypothetical protein [Alkalihalophilus marmarensis]
MKVVIQACIASLIIHVVYLMGTLGFGYLQTKFYEPNLVGQWEKVDHLQSEVGFGGVVIPPFLYAFTFVGMAIISGVIIFLLKRSVTKE